MGGRYTSPPHFYTIVKQTSLRLVQYRLIILLLWLPVDEVMATHGPQAHRLQETTRLAPRPQMAPTILRDPAHPQSRQLMTSRQIL